MRGLVGACMNLVEGCMSFIAYAVIRLIVMAHNVPFMTISGHLCSDQWATGKIFVKTKPATKLNHISGWVGLFGTLPLQVFLVPWPWGHKTFSSSLVTFPNYSLRTFQKKTAGSGQVRSPERVLTPPQKKFAIISELEFSIERFLLFRYSLQYQYVQFEYLGNCISVTWGQARVMQFALQAHGKIMKCFLLRVSESKPPNSFRIMTHYLICNETDVIYW